MIRPASTFVLSTILLCSGAFLLTTCESEVETETADHTEEHANHRPGLPLPEGFDIRVTGNIEQNLLQLAISVDVPEGSYVISALSDRDYLGKFQVHWTDSMVTPAGALVEDPVSMPGWEPWDKVYTPMLFESTTIRQAWTIPSQSDTLNGEVFFVLEPQCVPYALDFNVNLTTGTIQSGLIHPQYPD